MNQDGVSTAQQNGGPSIENGLEGQQAADFLKKVTSLLTLGPSQRRCANSVIARESSLANPD